MQEWMGSSWMMLPKWVTWLGRSSLCSTRPWSHQRPWRTCKPSKYCRMGLDPCKSLELLPIWNRASLRKVAMDQINRDKRMQVRKEEEILCCSGAEFISAWIGLFFMWQQISVFVSFSFFLFVSDLIMAVWVEKWMQVWKNFGMNIKMESERSNPGRNFHSSTIGKCNCVFVTFSDPVLHKLFQIFDFTY